MNSRAPNAILTWLWLCAFLNCAGWGLSALHQLNAAGYAAVLLAGATAFFLFIWKRKSEAQIFPRWQKMKRRFGHAFPLAFLILAAMTFLGGVLYAPTNYDGLAYRIPRVLHWLADGRWHWIHSVFPRVNGRACGIEWISAPLIALLKTDRWLFLINFASFLFLPGLVFSMFTRLGVRRRVAWHWMWIAPTGYCFLLQAGSIGNDLFGAPFALAAVDFALRAKISKSPRDFFASILAAALMTGAKTSNLPLLLPWAIAILPSINLIFRWPLRTAGISLVALFASVLPILVFNAHYYHGDWAGLSAEGDDKKGDLILRTASNATLMAVQNLEPPVFPLAGAWNHAVQKFMPAGLNARLHQIVVEPDAAEFHAEELQVEENAGLGFGACVLLLAGIMATARRRQCFLPESMEEIWRTSLCVAPFVSLIALLSQSEVGPLARILTPYYLLQLPFFLANPDHEQMTRRRWWRLSALAVFVVAAGLLVISPARPLFPVEIFLKKIHGIAARHPALARAETVYAVYHDRSDAFAPALAALPPGVKVLGLFTYDDPETSLWLPFGSRRIEHIRPEDTAADLKTKGVGYILLKTEGFEWRFGCTTGTWAARMNAQLVQKIPLRLRAGSPASDWWLVKLN